MTGNIPDATILTGFNLHPRWVQGTTPAEFLAPLIEAGLRAVEFELHPNQPYWSGFEPLMGACQKMGLRLCFHAPYRPPYAIEGFSGEGTAAIKELFTPMLSLAQRWAEAQGNLAPVVIHPAKSSQASRAALNADTHGFLAWALEAFPGLLLALENMGPPAPGELKAGDTRENVLVLVEGLPHHRLGICWDLGHDALWGRSAPPDAAWLKRVVHAHVHDLDESGQDHYPLVFGRVPACDWLHSLAQVGMHGAAVLEIKGGQLRTWDMARINQAIRDSLTAIRECAS